MHHAPCRGNLSLAQASAWSPLTSAYWAAEALQPSAIDPELLPLVQQAAPLVMPLIELAARRAWVPGKMDGARSQLSDPWERAATDDGAGWSRAELDEILTAAFALVLARQWTAPPPEFAPGGGAALALAAGDEPARWGFAGGAPEGPALLPLLAGLLEPDATSAAEGEAAVEGEGNVVVGVPPRPAVGSLGEGVCVRCVAARRIEKGERLVARQQ